MSAIACYHTREANSRPQVAERVRPHSVRVLGTSRVSALSGPRFTVGSARQNDLVLSDPYVSKHHCTLSLEDGGLWVQDNGSRNGTWVNNVRVERCRVAAGSRIVVGRSGLQLLGPAQETSPFGIVGRHASVQRMLRQVERVGPTMKPVLILGETGTGKELVARAIHECSPCRTSPFEPLNCGAIPRDLAEAELFGHAEGAFTGAHRTRRGAFERADGGTLFLDEVGEMLPELQPKLLRAAEEGIVQRVGEERRIKVAVRLVAATHRDLLTEAERGRFRLDLYHRLAVGIIEVPPLRERVADIPLLVRHFLRQMSGGGALSVEPAAMKLLEQHPWRGNVRELRNALHRAALEGGPRLGPDELGFLRGAGRPGEPTGTGYVRFEGRRFVEIRREIYARVLQSRGGNCAAAAAALGIPKSTFFDQVRALGIKGG